MHHPLARRIAHLSTAALTLSAAAAAQASVIQFDSRASMAGAANPAGTMAAIGAHYRDTIDPLVALAPGSGYCSQVLNQLAGVSNHGACTAGSSSNVAFRMSIDFGLDAGQAALPFSVRFAPDFGRGGALFLDGQLLAATATDLWWGGNWNATNELLTASGLNIGAGNHQLRLYGLEGCCDGGQGAQYRLGSNATWLNFASNDTLVRQANPVPEPGTLALVGLGLALALRRRSR